VLYTEEDTKLATYVRQYYAALHAMSGYYLTLYFFEHLPPSKGNLRTEIRKFWQNRLPPRWFEKWSTLGLTISKPYPNEYVYKVAENIGVSPDQFPCIVLFRNWKEIKMDRVIIEVTEPIPAFFRKLCTGVYKAVETIRTNTPANEFLDSATIQDIWSGGSSPLSTTSKKVEGSESRMSQSTSSVSVFLCHSSYDKPFVKRLAHDLRRFGLGVWLDSWEIRVGDSIVDRIEQGLRENDFLGIVLSPGLVSSTWVRRELNAAFIRELEERRVVILPILYRDCEIPLRIREKKYADFRVDYGAGLRTLLERLDPESTKQFDEMFKLFGEPEEPIDHVES